MEDYYGNMQESFPGNTWGVISVVLWKVLGEQKVHEAITRIGFLIIRKFVCILMLYLSSQ